MKWGFYLSLQTLNTAMVFVYLYRYKLFFHFLFNLSIMPRKTTTVKKTPPKKELAKKTPINKTSTNKNSTSKPVTKKVASKKPVEKKAPEKKSVKKIVEKKPAKKVATKKPVAKKIEIKKITRNIVDEKTPVIKKVTDSATLNKKSSAKKSSYRDWRKPKKTIPKVLRSAASFPPALPVPVEQALLKEPNISNKTTPPASIIDKHNYSKEDPNKTIQVSSKPKNAVKPSGKKPLWRK